MTDPITTQDNTYHIGSGSQYPNSMAGFAGCVIDDLQYNACFAGYCAADPKHKMETLSRIENCPVAASMVGRFHSQATANVPMFDMADTKGYKPIAQRLLGVGKTTTEKTMQSPILVKDGKAAVRLKIITTITQEGIDFRTRSEWGAKEPVDIPSTDWDYHSIALHHAGNSFGCLVDGTEGIRSAEAIDINSFGHLSYHYAIDCQGIIYEALDIRNKGAHIEGGNTGVVGVVFLADFSVRGEVDTYGPSVENVYNKRGLVAGFKEWLGTQNDNLDVTHDEPTQKQLEATDVLISTLLGNFPITILGGHREFAQKNGTSRACPGVYGMIVADIARRTFGLSMP